MIFFNRAREKYFYYCFILIHVSRKVFFFLLEKIKFIQKKGKPCILQRGKKYKIGTYASGVKKKRQN